MEWLPLLLSGVSSIASGWMGQNAANESTKAMQDALKQAMKYDQKTLKNVLGLNKKTIGQVLGLNRDATDASIGGINAGVDRALGFSNQGRDAANAALTDAEARGRADLAPWMQRGAEALEAYSGELGLTTPDGQPYQSKFRETAGYQFKKAEGEKSVVNNLARLGMRGSGAAMKELNRYGQGIADQEHDQYIDRLGGLSAAGQQASSQAANLAANTGAGVSANNMTAANNNAGHVLGGAQSVAGIRMGGAANAGNALMTGNSNAMDAILNRGGNISDNMINMGTAGGAGTVAGANAWTNSLKDFTNSLGRTLGNTSKGWGNILGGRFAVGGGL
jgi:hypothetical protein